MEGKEIEILTEADIQSLEGVLRTYGLAFPESYEEFPWGERAIKVRGKTFIFMRAEAGEISLSVKLPKSKESALALPFTEPTHYGLGKSGWVTSSFKVGESLPIDMIKTWIRESYIAVAPKKLSAQLDA